MSLTIGMDKIPVIDSLEFNLETKTLIQGFDVEDLAPNGYPLLFDYVKINVGNIFDAFSQEETTRILHETNVHIFRYEKEVKKYKCVWYDPGSTNYLAQNTDGTTSVVSSILHDGTEEQAYPISPGTYLVAMSFVNNDASKKIGGMMPFTQNAPFVSMHYPYADSPNVQNIQIDDYITISPNTNPERALLCEIGLRENQAYVKTKNGDLYTPILGCDQILYPEYIDINFKTMALGQFFYIDVNSDEAYMQGKNLYLNIGKEIQERRNIIEEKATLYLFSLNDENKLDFIIKKESCHVYKNNDGTRTLRFDLLTADSSTPLPDGTYLFVVSLDLDVKHKIPVFRGDYLPNMDFRYLSPHSSENFPSPFQIIAKSDLVDGNSLSLPTEKTDKRTLVLSITSDITIT